MSEEPQPIATLLVGAEGVAEIVDEPWQRQATEEERRAFVASQCKGDEQLYRKSLMDATGRPYWLLTILENAPDYVQEKAKRVARCLRVRE